MPDAVVILCTCSNAAEAESIAHALVEERLAACVTLLGGVRSIYRWQDNVEVAQEVLLLVKSTRERVPFLCARIEQLHSYEVPEIISLPIAEGSGKYLAWLADQVDAGSLRSSE